MHPFHTIDLVLRWNKGDIDFVVFFQDRQKISLQITLSVLSSTFLLIDGFKDLSFVRFLSDENFFVVFIAWNDRNLGIFFQSSLQLFVRPTWIHFFYLQWFSVNNWTNLNVEKTDVEVDAVGKKSMQLLSLTRTKRKKKNFSLKKIQLQL